MEIAQRSSNAFFAFALIFTVETRVLIFFAYYTFGMIVLYFLYGMRHSALAASNRA